MRCCIRTFVLIITCLCRFQSRRSYYCVSSLQLMCTHVCKGASSLSLQAASPRLPHRSKVCRGCPCHWQLYLKGVPPTAPAWCPSVPLQPRGGSAPLCRSTGELSARCKLEFPLGRCGEYYRNLAEPGKAPCFYVQGLASFNHVCCVAEVNTALVAVGLWSTSKLHLQGVPGFSLISSVTKRRNLL